MLKIARYATLSGLMLGLGFALSHFTSRAQPITPNIDKKLEAQVLEIIRANPEIVIEAIQKIQQQQQAQQQQQQANDQNQRLSQALSDPAQFLGNSPRQGPENADIILIEFSDFQCPYCAKTAPIVKQAIAQDPNLALIYKHFPLTNIHDQAEPAARAAWAAQQQGKFWDYHDRLFVLQPKLGDATYKAIATQLELDMDQFERDRTSPAAAQAIQQDVQLAQQLQVRGTPLFVMFSTANPTETGKVIFGIKDLPDLQQQIAQLKDTP